MFQTDKNPELKNWRFRWLSMLFEFSHLKYQKALWVEHKYENITGSFGEDMCKYFDDLYLDDHYNYQLENKVITSMELEVIRDFHFDLHNYNELKKSDKEILEDPEWQRIVDLGNKAWQQLKKIIKDEQELAHIKDLEKRYLNF